MDHLESLAHLRSELDRINALLTSPDWSAPVVACPGWDVEELIRHLGNVHRWSEGIVRTGELASNGERGPEGTDLLAGWFGEGAAALVSTLESANPEDGAWTLTKAGRSKGFWFRRQAQEALVHRIDLELALDDASPVEPALAADGIGEVWEVFLQRMVDRGEATPVAEPVTIRTTDTGDAWTLHPDRSVTADATGTGTIEGSAEALLLLLWKRIQDSDGRIKTSGSQAAISSITGGRITP